MYVTIDSWFGKTKNQNFSLFGKTFNEKCRGSVAIFQGFYRIRSSLN